MTSLIVENKTLMPDLKFSDNVPYKYYPVYFNNEVKSAHDLCILSADAQCQSGILAYLNLKELFKGNVNHEIKFDDIASLLQHYSKKTNKKGFCSWSFMNEKEATNIRQFIGRARVVTGFNYDGSLPEILEQYKMRALDKKIFSCQDWFETFLDRTLTLSQAIDYLGFWIELKSEQNSLKHVPDEEKSVLHNHQDNLFFTMFLAIIAHLVVNNRLNLD